MISVILTVLKIAGICILVLLGILVLLLGLIAFVPVRYRAQGKYQAGKAAVSGRITWLLHLISARISLEAGQALHIRVRLLGIPVFDNLRKAKKSGNKKRRKQETNTELQTASIAEDDTPQERETAAGAGGEAAPDKKAAQSDTAGERADADTATTWQAAAGPEEEESEAQAGTIFKKVKDFWKKFVHFIKNIKYTIRRICDTIVKIKNNISYYVKLLQEESTQAAFAACKGLLVQIFKDLSPRKYQVRLHLGFEDPAKLGEVMAVWGMLYPFHEGRVDIVPDFEQPVMEGDFFLKGRISVYVYIRTVLVLFFNKDIRRFYNRLRRNI